MSRLITEKQKAFAAAMYTIGSMTFGNGLQSAKTAKYKGNDNVLTQIAHKLVRNGKVQVEKKRIQAAVVAKYEHNRDIALNNLYTDYANLAVKAAAGDIQAIQARTAIQRELNAISALHSQQVNTTNKTLSINVQSKE